MSANRMLKMGMGRVEWFPCFRTARTRKVLASGRGTSWRAWVGG